MAHKNSEQHYLPLTKKKTIRIPVFILLLSLLISCDMITGYKIKKIIDSGEVIQKDFIKKIKFDFIKNVIIIQVKINDRKKCKFIFDTGSKYVLVSKKLVDEFDLKTVDVPASMVKTSSDSIDSLAVIPSFSTLEKIELGDVSFRDMGAMVLDFSKMGQLNDLASDGFVGVNLMKKCLWQINYRDTIIIMTNDIGRLEHINDAFKVNFTGQGIPQISATINDSIHIDLTFDTGFNGYIKISSNRLLKVIGKKGSGNIAERKEYRISDASGEKIINTYPFNVKCIRLDQKIFNNIPIEVLTEDLENSQQTKDNTGLIGNEFLKDFIVTLDWKDSVIYFSPNH